MTLPAEIATIRSELRRAVSASVVAERRRKRLRWGTVVAGVAIAIAAASAANLGGTGATNEARAAVLRRAATAVAADPRTVLHIKIRWLRASPGSERPATSDVWRLGGGATRSVQDEGSGGPILEIANDGAETSFFDPVSRRIYVLGNGSYHRLDLVGTLREAIRSGAATVSRRTYAGRAVDRIAFADGVEEGAVTYVEPSSGRPVAIGVWTSGGDRIDAVVDRFERLPATAENRSLLDLRQVHPGARVVRGAQAAARVFGRRWPGG